MKFEMPKLARLLSLLMLVTGLFVITACGDSNSTGEEKDPAFAEATAEGATDTEEPAEDKQKRPSPPAEASGTIGAAQVNVSYSSPDTKGRTIWGELVPYDAVWRTGANEATVFEVSQPVTINGKDLPAGKYGLFTIPRANGNWTFIFNETWEQWGAYNYDESKDVLRVDATATTLDEAAARLKFDVSDAGKVTMMWDKLAASFDVAAK